MDKQITSEFSAAKAEKAFGPKELLIIILGLVVIGVTMSLGSGSLAERTRKKP